MTEKGFTKFCTLWAEYWPSKPMTAEKQRAWWLALKPYRYADVIAAATVYAAKNKFPPDVYDITANLTPEKPEATTPSQSMDWINEILERELPSYKPSPITEYMREHNCATVGEACKALYGSESILDAPEG